MPWFFHVFPWFHHGSIRLFASQIGPVLSQEVPSEMLNRATNDPLYQRSLVLYTVRTSSGGKKHTGKVWGQMVRGIRENGSGHQRPFFFYLFLGFSACVSEM